MVRAFEDSDFHWIEKIFWETSVKKDFSTAQEKELFRKKYLDYFLFSKNGMTFVSCKDNVVKGYVTCVRDIRQEKEVLELSPWIHKFNNYFHQFPSQLHINLTEEVRGMGVGSLLISELEKKLKSENIIGIHLFTAENARNVRFYQSNHYSKIHDDRGILMLGKQI